MLPLAKGRFTARFATTPHDLNRALALRHQCFIADRGLVTPITDHDSFDDRCQHILIEDLGSGTLVCCFRLMKFVSGVFLSTSYSAQFYDLTRLIHYPEPMAELGRFCIHPDFTDPDILRIAWGALARMVDGLNVHMLFGCTSFDGANPALHDAAFAFLHGAHLAPDRWKVGVKSPDAYLFPKASGADPARAMALMPPLLRTYLAMGGWVSDHAVIDAKLNTTHVFTALEISAIPPRRARLLRELAT